MQKQQVFTFNKEAETALIIVLKVVDKTSISFSKLMDKKSISCKKTEIASINYIKKETTSISFSKMLEMASLFQKKKSKYERLKM